MLIEYLTTFDGARTWKPLMHTSYLERRRFDVNDEKYTLAVVIQQQQIRVFTHDPKRNQVGLKSQDPKERDSKDDRQSDLGGSPFVLCASAAKSFENGTLSIMMISILIAGGLSC